MKRLGNMIIFPLDSGLQLHESSIKVTHQIGTNILMTMGNTSSYSKTYFDEDKLTLWQLYEKAAKTKFGSDIKVISFKWIVKQVYDLSFQISVVRADPEPTEKTRTIADINMKEYSNPADTSVDETIVRMTKKNITSTGNRYQFSTTKGVSWDVGGNIGGQLMGVAMGGAGVSIGGRYGKVKTSTTVNEQNLAQGFEIGYEQEEKICVQPHTKVKATITTYAMKYKQGYTIKLTIPKDVTLDLVYRNRCNQLLCGARWDKITAAELFSELPGYTEEDDKVSFLQEHSLGSGKAPRWRRLWSLFLLLSCPSCAQTKCQIFVLLLMHCNDTVLKHCFMINYISKSDYKIQWKYSDYREHWKLSTWIVGLVSRDKDTSVQNTSMQML